MPDARNVRYRWLVTGSNDEKRIFRLLQHRASFIRSRRMRCRPSTSVKVRVLLLLKRHDYHCCQPVDCHSYECNNREWIAAQRA